MIEFKSMSIKVIEGGYEVMGDFMMYGMIKKIMIVLKGGKEYDFKKVK